MTGNNNLDESCSDADGESDNFSVDSLDTGSEKITDKHRNVPATNVMDINSDDVSISKSHTKVVEINSQYVINDQSNCNGSHIHSETEQLAEANISKVDIVLTGISDDLENGKVKSERKFVKVFHRRTQSASRAKNQINSNQSLAEKHKKNNLKASSNYLERSKSTDNRSSLQANPSGRSTSRRIFDQFTPNRRNDVKKSTSYLEQYRGRNGKNLDNVDEVNNSTPNQSQVSIVTSQSDESQLYSDIINGIMQEGSQSELNSNDHFDHELKSVSAQDFKSDSDMRKIQFDSSRCLNYTPYTVKDRLLVLPTKLGSLGPDPSSYRDKAQSSKKRQQYGIFASLKNMEIIRQNNLKKKIAEVETNGYESSFDEDVRPSACDQLESISISYSSSDSSKDETKEKPPRDHAAVRDDKSKKQSKVGCRNYKKKTPAEEKINDTESSLDLINKLLRERHKNELIINKMF